MKNILIYLLLFLNFKLISQNQIIDSVNIKPKFKIFTKTNTVGFSLSFVSGFSRGLEQTLVYHYSKFDKVFPNVNQQYWNPAISWTNKYKNNNPLEGPKFFGSTTIFSNTTDAKHLFDSISKYTLIGGCVFISLHEKKPIKQYLIDGLISSIGYSIGFSTSYEYFNLK